MNFFDLVFIIILIIFPFLCFREGMLGSLISTFSLLIGYGLGEILQETLVQYPLQFIDNIGVAQVIILLIFVILGYFTGEIIRRLSNIFFNFGKLSALLNFLILLTGLLKGYIFCLLLVFIVSHSIPSFFDDLETSMFYPFLQMTRDFIIGFNFA